MFQKQIVVFKKGNVPHNKGQKATDEEKQIMKERMNRPEIRNKISKSHFGIKPSLETRKKMSLARKGKSPWNKGKTNAGDVQVMSAGTGVKHSEHNLEDETTSLYQIWIKPNALNVEPRWDAMEFPKEHVENKLNLIVGGSDEAPLFIHADADIYAGKIQAKKELNHKLKRSGYVLASFGAFEVNGIKLKKGDALEITDADELKIITQEESELLVIDV